MNRWERVQGLFEQALALGPAERGAFLRERTRAEAGLVREVERLLEADAAPLADFDRPATAVLEALRVEEQPEELCGCEFESYRIEQHLSSGGMGHVYLALRRSAGIERRVAIKVLRVGLDTQAFLARFQRERETLAGLEHEHIVSFLDAGALPDGRPFLVMEYVEGRPLTEWGQGLPLRERLASFLQVLAAVQYAHTQLVLHRDLKPSNVLVTQQGVPKLLDFGVATMLDLGGEAPSEGTPLTLGYASPEQVRGEPATTASDVWSLGVLLRELVAAARAERVSEGGGRAPDLDAIVRKALEEDSRRRYHSADALADDLRRYLAREAVSAQPPRWRYRTALYARRNAWPLASAGLVLLALIVGWVGSDLDRRNAQVEASMGWGAHAEARVVARVFEGWIESIAQADEGLGLAAAEHMERALREELSNLPEAETLVRLMLAQLYLDRGEPELAGVHAQRAWQLAQSTRGIGKRERERAAALRQRILGEG